MSLLCVVVSEGFGVREDNYMTKDMALQAKKVVVDSAKEWPIYFCRLFPVDVSWPTFSFALLCLSLL